MSKSFTRRSTAALALIVGLGVAVLPAASASAATTIDGPIDLGTATSFGVLAASAITNTGPTTITGDLGISPGTAVTGAPLVGGTRHETDAVAIQAQSDLTTAYNAAAGLTPTTSGVGELSGLSLTPGVYSGDALSLTGTLTLAGTADAIWVFQAASTLTTASASQIIITGGATSCNVFWKVSTSATLGTSSNFVGTIMAAQSITATTSATIQGRLLASVGAVTLDSNVITQPTGCAPGTTPTTSPAFTSTAPTGTAVVGTPYTSTITASGTPTATYTVTSGALPTGLTLNPTTGAITGTPTTPGSYTFTVTAANGTAPDVAAEYTIVVSPVGVSPAVAAELAATGSEALPVVFVAGGLLVLGGVFLALRAMSRRRHN